MNRYEVSRKSDETEARLMLGATPLTIGRSPTSDMVLTEETVSWHHAHLWVEGDQVWVRDLNSRNGTYINDERVRADGRLDARLAEVDDLALLGEPRTGDGVFFFPKFFGRVRRAGGERRRPGRAESTPGPRMFTSWMSGMAVQPSFLSVAPIFLSSDDAVLCIVFFFRRAVPLPPVRESAATPPKRRAIIFSRASLMSMAGIDAGGATCG